MANLDLLLVSEEHTVRGSVVYTKWNTQYRLLSPSENKITLNSFFVGHGKTRIWGHPYEDYFGSEEKNDGEVGKINVTNNSSGFLYLDDKRIAKYERSNGKSQAFTIKDKNGLEICQDLPLDYLLEKVNQFSFDNLYGSIYKRLRQIGPCTFRDLLKDPIFKEAPPKRVKEALNLLLYRSFVDVTPNGRLVQMPYYKR